MLFISSSVPSFSLLHLTHHPEKSKEDFSDQCSSVTVRYNQGLGVHYIIKCWDLVTDQIKSAEGNYQGSTYIAFFLSKTWPVFKEENFSYFDTHFVLSSKVTGENPQMYTHLLSGYYYDFSFMCHALQRRYFITKEPESLSKPKPSCTTSNTEENLHK